MKSLSQKHSDIEASLTLAISAEAKALKAQGKNVISLASGEPDFKAPAFVRSQAQDAIENQPITYTSADGLKALREAIANNVKATLNVDYTPDQILVTNGAKQALYNALQVICEPGDEVLVIKPHWVSYIPLIKLAGATPISVACKPDYQPDLDAFDQALSAKTKAVIINSPNNPTGAIYTRSVLKHISEKALEHDFFILSDEIYSELTYEQDHLSILEVEKRIYDQTLLINGFSKTYAMTGYRLGYVAGNKKLINLMKRLQSHASSNVNTIAQYAGLAALSLDQTAIKPMLDAYTKRRDKALKRFEAIPQIKAYKPQGAFYLWLNVEAIIGKRYLETKIASAFDLAKLLLKEKHVALIPGEAFGLENHLRFSIATSEADIETGIERLNAFCKALK